MPAISDNLIHFLGRKDKDSPLKQLQTFKSIMIHGLQSSKFQVHFNSGTLSNHVVCFTDIPLSHCDEHTAVYGKFGIGFKKSYVKKNGGNPARYFIDHMPFTNGDKGIIDNRGLIHINLSELFSFVNTINGFIEKDNSFGLYDKNGQLVFDYKKLKEWVSQQLALLSFEKEMGDHGPARDEAQGIDHYYKEREWKLVPMEGCVASGFVVYNKEKEVYTYSFKRNDINVVITPNNEIRMEVIRFFLSLAQEEDIRLKEFANDIPTVITYDDLYKW